MIASLVLLPLVLAAPSPSDSPDIAKSVRQIPIDERQSFQVYRVYTAPGYPVEVEFPDAFASNPACGDCVAKKDLGNKKAPGLFIFDVDREQNFFTIKPRYFAGRQEDGSEILEKEYFTPVNVRLVSHLTLTVEVHYTEDRSKADARVVFSIPGRASETEYVRAQIEAARKKMLDEQAAKIDEGVEQSLMQMFADPHRCVPSDALSRHDDVVVEVKEVCRFGGLALIRFEVTNRSRLSVFSIGSVDVLHAAAKSASSVEDVKQRIPTLDVEFSKPPVAGVVSFHLPEGEQAPRYTIKLVEDGGRHRTVPSAEIAF